MISIIPPEIFNIVYNYIGKYAMHKYKMNLVCRKFNCDIVYSESLFECSLCKTIRPKLVSKKCRYCWKQICIYCCKNGCTYDHCNNYICTLCLTRKKRLPQCSCEIIRCANGCIQNCECVKEVHYNRAFTTYLLDYDSVEYRNSICTNKSCEECTQSCQRIEYITNVSKSHNKREYTYTSQLKTKNVCRECSIQKRCDQCGRECECIFTCPHCNDQICYDCKIMCEHVNVYCFAAMHDTIYRQCHPMLCICCKNCAVPCPCCNKLYNKSHPLIQCERCERSFCKSRMCPYYGCRDHSGCKNVCLKCSDKCTHCNRSIELNKKFLSDTRVCSMDEGGEIKYRDSYGKCIEFVNCASHYRRHNLCGLDDNRFCNKCLSVGQCCIGTPYSRMLYDVKEQSSENDTSSIDALDDNVDEYIVVVSNPECIANCRGSRGYRKKMRRVCV